MSWFVLLDVVVAVLLVATIVYAVLLNRKLGHLRGNRSEVEKSVADFHDAVTKAEVSIATLRLSADGLQQQLDKAQALKDDLALLIARGNSAADALEEAVRAGRQPREATSRPRSAAAQMSAAARKQPASAPPRSEAERELLKALASSR